MDQNRIPALMPESKANDQTIILYDYAYTIDIAPSKFIRKYGRWSNLKQDLQKTLLNNLIKQCFKDSHISDIYANACYYVFEETKKKNIHAHGSFYGTIEQAFAFQTFVHKQVGLPTCPLDRACFITATEVCHSFWDNYKQKDKLDIFMF